MKTISRMLIGSMACWAVLITPPAWAADTPVPVVKTAPISSDGTDPKIWDMKQDGVLVAPQNHKVIYEDSYVRVLSVTVPAGTEELYHLHPYYSVIIRDSSPPAGDVLDRCANGALCVNSQVVDAITAPVLVRVVPPQAIHSAKNNGSRDIHQTRVEFKTGIIPTLIHPDWPNGKMPISDDGTDPATWDSNLDGVIAVPDAHHVVFEDDSIRILSEVLPAGIGKPQHTHPFPSVMIRYGDLPLSGTVTDVSGKVTSYSASGATGIYTDVVVAEPAASHSNKITGPHPAHIIRIEFKKGFPQP